MKCLAAHEGAASRGHVCSTEPRTNSAKQCWRWSLAPCGTWRGLHQMWCFTFGVTPKSSKSCHCSWIFIGKAWKTMGLPTIWGSPEFFETWPPWPWPDAAASSASWRCRRRNLGSPSPGVSHELTSLAHPREETSSLHHILVYIIYYINNYCIQYYMYI